LKVMSAEDELLLTSMARRPSLRPPSPRDADRLARLVAGGYVTKDPAMKAPIFRLTIRGWAFVRDARLKAN